MKPSPESEKNLERFVSAVLRELPARRAPRSLQSRVLAELERRAALPWWHKSFAHWPIIARAAFVVASAGVVKGVLMAAVWIMAGFDRVQFAQAFAPQFAWVEAVQVVAGSMADFALAVVHGIPSAWLYGGAIAFVALYAALFGLGTAAYRTLYANR
jgi:hypothetical protein